MAAAELTGLAAAVRPEQVHALLLSRAPAPLDPNSDDHELYVETIRGVATEVALYAGQAISGPRWDLAVWAVTLGAAASLEAAMLPQENGLDQTALGRSLTARYAAVLAKLDGNLPGDPTGGPDVGAPPAAAGSFPPAPADDPSCASGYVGDNAWPGHRVRIGYLGSGW